MVFYHQLSWLGCSFLLLYGFAFNFWSIAAFRMFVGVGEASFTSLAASFIDDNAPVSQKTAWLGMFYMCIPTGYAVGYVYGGLVGTHYTWCQAFFGEAILMFPFVLLGFFMKPLQLKDSEASASRDSALSTRDELNDGDVDQFSRFFKEMKALLCEKMIFVVNVLGYVIYNFVFGAYSYWGPKASYNIYNMKKMQI